MVKTAIQQRVLDKNDQQRIPRHVKPRLQAGEYPARARCGIQPRRPNVTDSKMHGHGNCHTRKRVAFARRSASFIQTKSLNSIWHSTPECVAAIATGSTKGRALMSPLDWAEIDDWKVLRLLRSKPGPGVRRATQRDGYRRAQNPSGTFRRYGPCHPEAERSRS
jgi:hypothetical protein